MKTFAPTTDNIASVLEVHTGLPLLEYNPDNSSSSAVLTEPLLTKEASSSSTESSSSSSSVLQFTWWDHLCLLVILPMLLILQFTIGSNNNDNENNTMDLHTVYGIIVLFVITAYLYRSSLNDVSISNPYGMQILVLMPEILMDVILGIVLWKDADTAFMVLLVITLLLSGFVILTTLSVLCRGYKPTEQEEETSRIETAQPKQNIECFIV